ncbi:hypothetical protein [Psychromonas hadalis]|uniref:hypothetical protein n=1 Tax=Psychromonas hadalis TaxID=211669 RepID=UPI0004224E98|nr:hypothetical protein [Psychromonas hadalis]
MLLDHQGILRIQIIRMNSDTLYTRLILDVKGGATITSKDYDGFQNIMVFR